MEEYKDDISLLNLIKNGDDGAFKHLFETYFVSLCRFMHLYIPDKTLVEDTALDIFVYIWENRHTLHIRLTFKAYLFQAARNRCLNILCRKNQTVSIDEIDKDIVDTGVMSLENDELYRLIQEAIFALPGRCREVFHLSREENFSNKEIAEKLNISVKTVEAQITKALKKIKDFLGDAYSYLW